MSEGIKIYHVETQEDYDDLMIELEKQGYTWFSGKKPTHINTWTGEETIIYSNDREDYTITYGFISTARENYPNRDFIKHKAKGVEQMEKVVVPQFVANWFERNKKGHTIYGSLHLFSDNYYLFDGFRKWVEDYDLKEEDAQEIIAKMYLFQDYEVEEKKYYWRKKNDCYLSFEYSGDSNYLNLNTNDGLITFASKDEFGYYRTKFTENEIEELLGEEDFNKLERVEIDE